MQSCQEAHAYQSGSRPGGRTGSPQTHQAPAYVRDIVSTGRVQRQVQVEVAPPPQHAQRGASLHPLHRVLGGLNIPEAHMRKTSTNPRHTREMTCVPFHTCILHTARPAPLKTVQCKAVPERSRNLSHHAFTRQGLAIARTSQPSFSNSSWRSEKAVISVGQTKVKSRG